MTHMTLTLTVKSLFLSVQYDFSHILQAACLSEQSLLLCLFTAVPHPFYCLVLLFSSSALQEGQPEGWLAAKTHKHTHWNKTHTLMHACILTEQVLHICTHAMSHSHTSTHTQIQTDTDTEQAHICVDRTLKSQITIIYYEEIDYLKSCQHI